MANLWADVRVTEITQRELQRTRQLRARRGVMTRRVYGYEDSYLSTIKKLNQQRDLNSLLRFAKKIWTKHYAGNRKLPEVRFGPGTRELGYPLSYTVGYSLIELAPGQRNILTLVHELVHAIGPSEHGTNFVRLYYQVLAQYLPAKVREQVYQYLVKEHAALMRRVYRK
jgi:hypothetical protein